MTKPCFTLNPLQRDGTNQNQRMLDALNPAYALIDDRELSDMLNYALDFAESIRFVNSQNLNDGNWVSFIENDISTLVAIIKDTSLNSHKSQTETVIDNLNAVQIASKQAYIEQLFNQFNQLITYADNWYSKSVKELELNKDLENQIKSVLSESLRSALAYEKSYNEWSGSSAIIITDGLQDIWLIDNIQAESTYFREGLLNTEIDYESLSFRIKLLLQSFYDSLEGIIEKSNTYLAETLHNYPEHQPYIGLFIAFLKIFEYTQSHLNTLGRKHLDYYYKEVLGIKPKPEVPDKVHLVFELAKSFSEFKLEKGTLFTAGKDDNNAEMLFASDSEFIINKAKLAEAGLKTIFLDKEYESNPPEKETPFTIKNIYAAPKANSADGKGAVIEDSDGKWDTLGSNKMPFAKVGFAVASPMFFLSEGKRTVIVKFEVSKPVDLHYGLGSNNELTITNELKNNLLVYYTGEKEWVATSIERAKIDLSENSEEGFIEFELLIGKDAEAVVAYNEKAHASNFTTKWPVFKFILDNLGLSGVLFSTDCRIIESKDELSLVNDQVAARIIDFLNSAETAEDIAGLEPAQGPVFDNPNTGYGDQVNDYDIGLTTAQQLLNHRPENGFESLEELKNIPGLGIDKLNDLIASFCAFASKSLCEVKNNTKEFNFETEYSRDDFVWFNEYVYRARKTTKGAQPNLNPLHWKLVPRSYPYKYFQHLDVLSTTYTVIVDGMTSLILENDVGVLNPSKPFQPFGPIPKIGSKFFIGSPEIFQKSLNSLTLNIDWADLPNQSFNQHYNYYESLTGNDTSPVADNHDFSGHFEVLHGGEWKSETFTANKSNLFEPETGAVNTSNSFTLTFDDLYGRKPNLEPFSRLSTQLLRGFIMFELEQHFYHKKYPVALGKAAITEGNTNVPNEPYTPLIESFSVNYEAEETISYNTKEKKDFDTRVEQLFHIHPFGHIEFYPIAGESSNTIYINTKIVPEFLVNEYDSAKQNYTTTDAEGSLLIGLTDIVAPQNLSILFQVAEGSEDPDKSKQELTWSFLANNCWIDFEVAEIIQERTNDFLTSGIVKLSIPRPITDSNTILESGIFWIKASTARETGAICKMIAVIPQAISATFLPTDNNDLKRLSKPLEAELISKLKYRQAGIKKVSQPFASFDGQLPELSQEDVLIANLEEHNRKFYIRVSERLRHKNRGVNIWDYERMVLQQFPEVYKVKCINHTNCCTEHAPGSVKLIVIPDLRNKNAVNPLKPRLSLNKLTEIFDYIKLHISDFVKLLVKNPQFEEIKVEFKAALYPGKDAGFYFNKMQEDIRNFLTPWLFDEGKDLVLGGEIHRSVILNFIEETDYLDYLTDFKMFHRAEPNGSWKEVEEAKATTSSSTLVSAPNHDIQLL